MAKRIIIEMLSKSDSVFKRRVVLEVMYRADPHMLIRFGERQINKRHGSRKEPIGYEERIERGAARVVDIAANDLKRADRIVQEGSGSMSVYREKGNDNAKESN